MREDEFDYRWIRPGWFDQERHCDAVVQSAFSLLPGETMEQRWYAANNIAFIQKYGTGIKWCKTMSYHTLIINGWNILRMWTNTSSAAVVLVEVNNRLAKLLEENLFLLEEVPVGTLKRRPEFSQRFRLALPEELEFLMELVKVTYGVGNT